MSTRGTLTLTPLSPPVRLLCPEVIYEDLQYLSVSALVLVCLAGLLMLSMWLLNRAYKKIKSCIRHREQRNGKAEHSQSQCFIDQMHRVTNWIYT